jgi:hypothetical protein
MEKVFPKPNDKMNNSSRSMPSPKSAKSKKKQKSSDGEK